MFIVHSGTLHMEVLIEVELYQKHPIGCKKWELTTTVWKFIYRVRTLEEGDIFGHEELIPPENNHYTQTSYTLRHCQVVSGGSSWVFYINKPIFETFFTEEDKKFIIEERPRIDPSQLGKNLITFMKSKHIKSKQILNGIGSNYINHSNWMQLWDENDKKTMRLWGWLEKAKNKTFFNKWYLEQ